MVVLKRLLLIQFKIVLLKKKKSNIKPVSFLNEKIMLLLDKEMIFDIHYSTANISLPCYMPSLFFLIV